MEQGILLFGNYRNYDDDYAILGHSNDASACQFYNNIPRAPPPCALKVTDINLNFCNVLLKIMPAAHIPNIGQS